ncbi:hypothetical protein LV779_35985 [Streptomyces thinghirensis]|nr:hypothetical protein [Streptomyces thinghirensis]
MNSYSAVPCRPSGSAPCGCGTVRHAGPSWSPGAESSTGPPSTGCSTGPSVRAALAVRLRRHAGLGCPGCAEGRLPRGCAGGSSG